MDCNHEVSYVINATLIILSTIKLQCYVGRYQSIIACHVGMIDPMVELERGQMSTYLSMSQRKDTA